MLDRLLRWRPGFPSLLPRPAASSPAAAPDGDIDEVFLSRLRRLALASQRRLTSGHTGEHASRRRGQALEFADYRSYTPGDDLRLVDWNAYLRHEHLFLKLADAQERIDLYILLDTSRSMAWGWPDKFGYARRIAVGLAHVALGHMDAACLYALQGAQSTRLAHRQGQAATARVVQAVNSLRPEGTTELDAALGHFAAQANHRGVAILISDLLSPAGYQAGLERLHGTALRTVVIHVLSPEEMSPTLEGDLELQDVETDERVQVSVDWGTLTRYRRWLGEWLSDIEGFCARRGITYIRTETTQPVEQLLLDRLRRERVLR